MAASCTPQLTPSVEVIEALGGSPVLMESELQHDNRWYSYALQWDGSQMILAIDGQPAASQGMPPWQSAAGQLFAVCCCLTLALTTSRSLRACRSSPCCHVMDPTRL